MYCLRRQEIYSYWNIRNLLIMGKLALTIPRFANYLASFNKEYNTKFKIEFDEKFIYLREKGSNELLFYAKVDYAEDFLLPIGFMKSCGYYCSFGNKNIKKTDYYRNKSRNNTFNKKQKLWKREILLSDFEWL